MIKKFSGFAELLLLRTPFRMSTCSAMHSLTKLTVQLGRGQRNSIERVQVMPRAKCAHAPIAALCNGARFVSARGSCFVALLCA
eukprot:5685445-Amphidinium_carterae.1